MLEAFYYSFLLTLSIIVALCIIDERFAYFLWVWLQIGRLTIAKWYMMAKLYPGYFFTTWLMKRRIAKLTRELQEELVKTQTEQEQ